MKVIDAHWEQRNLGCTTAELQLCNTADIQELSEWDSAPGNLYQYRVAKLSAQATESPWALAQLGYTYAESQFLLKCHRDDFLIPKGVERYLAYFTAEEQNTPETLAAINEQIERGMFTTDRIYLDPHFSHQQAAQRYINWIGDIAKGPCSLLSMLASNKPIGFTLSTLHGDTMKAILGGVYADYQGRGLILPLTVKEYQHSFEQASTITTAVSGNNPDILKAHLKMGFEITDIHHVYVKHVV